MIKNTKELILDYIKQETAKGNAELDTTSIANALRVQRSNASALLNQLVAEEKICKTKTRPVYYSLPNEDEFNDYFNKLIGYEGSLNSVIQLAKAAILYPNKSLNSLIIGSIGTGKSYLANLMFEYAKRKGVVPRTAEFIKVNCRHFVNNPQELTESLFGNPNITKRPNLFDLADNSILFIDNIDLLDGASIGRINAFIDSGHYYYADGEKSEIKNVTLIISIDRKANPDILYSLRTKIPVRIEMPDLKARPMDEKFELINHFFTEEAISTKYDIAVDPEVVHALMIVDSNLNVKFLYGAIKVAVANAYLRCYDSDINTIQVVKSDFEREVTDALIHFKNYKDEIMKVIPASFGFTYNKEGNQPHHDDFSRDFYDYLNQKISLLQKQNFSKDKIDQTINEEINELIRGFKKEILKSDLNINQLSKVVDRKIIEMVTSFIRECSDSLKVDYPNSVIYGLCLHINAISKNKRDAKILNVEKVNEVITNYSQEYAWAKDLSERVEQITGKRLSMDETVMLTMFLIHDHDEGENKHPQVLIAMHGDSSAASIANVVNDLVKMNNTYAYDMSLSKSSEVAYKELKEIIQEIDQGRGVLVIYDMGSLKTILDQICIELSIPIRLIYVPITLIGIEVSRKASMESDIDKVYHSFVASMNKDMKLTSASQDAIITLCHTGEGGALEIKEYLQKNYRNDIKIYALAISDRKRLADEVQTIKKYYNIKAFIGTYNPKLFGIPFVPVSRIFESSIQDLDYLLLMNKEAKNIDFEQMLEYLHGEVAIDKDKMKQSLPKVMKELDQEFGLNVDQQVGLFLHIGALINRLIHKVALTDNPNTTKYFEESKQDVLKIRDSLKVIERTFDVIVPDTEVATIFEIVKKEI